MKSHGKFDLDERRKTIRRFRKQLKLSQTEFAAMAGIGPSMLSRFENGSRDLSPETFANVEEAITDALAQRKADLQRTEASTATLADLKHPERLARRNPGLSPRETKAAVDEGRKQYWKELLAEKDARIKELQALNAALQESNATLRALLDIRTKEHLLRIEGDELKARIEKHGK